MLKLLYMHKSEFFPKKDFMFEKIVATTINAWWPILIKWKQFWEWTRLNGGIPKEFYKGVSYTLNDFTIWNAKL